MLNVTCIHKLHTNTYACVFFILFAKRFMSDVFLSRVIVINRICKVLKLPLKRERNIYFYTITCFYQTVMQSKIFNNFLQCPMQMYVQLGSRYCLSLLFCLSVHIYPLLYIYHMASKKTYQNISPEVTRKPQRDMSSDAEGRE